jgi:hypothetical protein
VVAVSHIQHKFFFIFIIPQKLIEKPSFYWYHLEFFYLCEKRTKTGNNIVKVKLIQICIKFLTEIIVVRGLCSLIYRDLVTEERDLLVRM